MSEGMRFLSGGEDVAAAVEWVKSKYNAGNGSRDVLLMGNSAGGVRVATFMLKLRFAALRVSILSGIVGGMSLRGYILLAVPFDFRNAAADRAATLNNLGQGLRRLPVGFAAELQTSGRIIAKDLGPLGDARS